MGESCWNHSPKDVGAAVRAWADFAPIGTAAGVHAEQSPNGRRAAVENTEAAPVAAGSIERVSTALRVQWRALRAGQAAAIAAEGG